LKGIVDKKAVDGVRASIRLKFLDVDSNTGFRIEIDGEGMTLMLSIFSQVAGNMPVGHTERTIVFNGAK